VQLLATLAGRCVPQIIELAIMLGVKYEPQNRGVLLFAYTAILGINLFEI